MSAASPELPPGPPAGGFWHRRLLQPLQRQLVQGVTPRKLAATLAVGTVCSLFPFLGFTSLLNLGVGVALRLNQPLLQGWNQLLGPLQLLLILPYVRAGERLWGAPAGAFSVDAMLESFAGASWGEFFARFGWAGVHAFTAWLVTAPLLMAVLYLPLVPVFTRTAGRLRRASVLPVGA
jgi:uncharacterized protein (DUF2062 family)